ncbi:transposase [Tuanshanicoccus lijuaniae]|uniref:RNA-guided endonuclease InsQ/TnpB family protein n=1 Tax=Aerococcaceae bacterium zg-1292 TaxID=2774330 RepID=UPI0019350F80|nr:transposase [Aerococcaceae bacterium zg-1292]
MKKAIKIKLFPTDEQQELLFQSCGVARKAYNLCKELDLQYLKQFGKGINDRDFGPLMTQIRRGDDFPYMKLVSADVAKQAVKDYITARSRSFKNFKNGYHVNWKTRKSKLSFYADYVKTKVKRKAVYISMIGDIKTSSQLPRNFKLGNPRVSYDGLSWWISITTEVPKPEQVELTDVSIGLDLGLTTLVTTSDGQTFDNIMKSESVKELDKKIKQYQRALSRKERGSKKYQQTYERFLKCVQKKTNIRRNYAFHVANALVRTKPKRIVMESLSIKHMLKNKRLAKAIHDVAWYNLQTIIIQKANFFGIEVVKVDSRFPSSQLCCVCGNRQPMPLDKREYNCQHCGISINRDLNAAINLASI